MIDTLEIRRFEDGDIAPAVAMLRVLAQRYIVHESTPEEAAAFLEANNAQAMRGFLAGPYVYHAAIIGGALAGFVAVREHKHLYHLFVASVWHGRGIARALCDVARRHALAAGGDGSLTVNASSFAVPVYESMGFVRTAPLQSVKGLQVNPMRLDASWPALVGAP